MARRPLPTNGLWFLTWSFKKACSVLMFDWIIVHGVLRCNLWSYSPLCLPSSPRLNAYSYPAWLLLFAFSLHPPCTNLVLPYACLSEIDKYALMPFCLAHALNSVVSIGCSSNASWITFWYLQESLWSARCKMEHDLANQFWDPHLSKTTCGTSDGKLPMSYEMVSLIAFTLSYKPDPNMRVLPGGI